MARPRGWTGERSLDPWMAADAVLHAVAVDMAAVEDELLSFSRREQRESRKAQSVAGRFAAKQGWSE